MKLHLVILFLLPALVAATTSISERVNLVQSKLEVLNAIGMKCEAELNVKGLVATRTQICKKYLKNASGEFLNGIQTECVSLLNWFNEKAKTYKANPKQLNDEQSKAL